MTGEGQAGTHGRVNLTEENALRDWSARFGVIEPRLFAAGLAAGDEGSAPFSLRSDVTGRDEGIVLRPGPTLPDRGGR